MLVLTQFSASSTNDPYDEGHAKAWTELPEKRVDENFVYVSHFASLNNHTVRNYSFCYDKRSMWRIGWLIRCIRYIGGR